MFLAQTVKKNITNQGTFAPVRYSGFGIRFRYSVFTTFPDLKDLKKNKKWKILPQPIIFSRDKALTYPKY